MFRKIKLLVLTFISFIAGIHLLISPDTVNEWIIRGVGLIWSIEGVNYFLEFNKLLLERKKENLQRDISDRY